MRPCDNCKRKESCAAFGFLRKNYKQSPWKLDSYLRENLSYASLVTAMSGDVDSIVLECGDYNPIKSETDYSYLSNSRRKSEKPAPPPDKCGGCKGKCGS